MSSNELDAVRLERARHQGREAFIAGAQGDECPYAPGSGERMAWLESWDAARAFRERLDQHLMRQA